MKKQPGWFDLAEGWRQMLALPGWVQLLVVGAAVLVGAVGGQQLARWQIDRDARELRGFTWYRNPGTHVVRRGDSAVVPGQPGFCRLEAWLAPANSSDLLSPDAWQPVPETVGDDGVVLADLNGDGYHDVVTAWFDTGEVVDPDDEKRERARARGEPTWVAQPVENLRRWDSGSLDRDGDGDLDWPCSMSCASAPDPGADLVVVPEVDTTDMDVGP